MAYDSTIPSLSNLIGDDIPQMQENFQLLEDSQVVDEGSTADGDYIRYENGWQVCYKTYLELSYDSSDRYDTSWGYPVDFNAEPYTNGHIYAHSILGLADSFDISDLELARTRFYPRNVGAESTSYRFENRVDSPFEDKGAVDNFTVFAIGRWK